MEVFDDVELANAVLDANVPVIAAMFWEFYFLLECCFYFSGETDAQSDNST